MFVVLWAALQTEKWYKNCAGDFWPTKDTEKASKPPKPCQSEFSKTP